MRKSLFNAVIVCLFLAAIVGLVTATCAGRPSFGLAMLAIFFGSLVVLSRTGHSDLAAILFVGFFFLASTWGELAWSTALPVAMLSYGATIVMATLLLGTGFGLATSAAVLTATFLLGYLESHGLVQSDTAWRFQPLALKDAFEDALVYLLILTVTWLSNRQLEAKVEERTRQIRALELDKMAQMYRLIEFGRLSSGIFHDLMNPLSVVSLSVERLGDESDFDKAEARAHIERAVSASRRLESRIDAAKKQLATERSRCAFSLNEEIQQAIGLLEHKSKQAGATIEFNQIARIETVGDPIKFFQAIVNLISNAIDSYDGRSGDKPVTVSVRKAAGQGIVSIRDHGCGIRKDLVGRIFDPFFTTKPRGRADSGIGLGLTNTKEIIERGFSGAIRVESGEGAGSTFTIAIPILGGEREKAG